MKSMDHESVIAGHFAERYFLGELSVPERDSFEDHMSDCSVCRSELLAMDQFAANAVAVFEAQASRHAVPVTVVDRLRDWFRLRPVPLLAFSGLVNVCLLMVVGYGVTHPVDNSPGSAEIVVVRPPARSSSLQIVVLRKSTSFAVLRFDLPHPYQKYSWSFEGAPPQSLPAPVDPETLSFSVPVRSLAPGDHKLQVLGVDGEKTVTIGECVLRVPAGSR